MVIFHEKFESNPDFICNYIKMKKEEEITRKLSISKLIPNNDNKNVQKDQNFLNEVEVQIKEELEKTKPVSQLKITTSNRVTKRSNSNIDEVPKKKTIKTKNQNIIQQNRRVPVNTPISSNLTNITRHGRIISVKKFKLK